LDPAITQDKNIIENFRLSEEFLKNNNIQKYSILDMKFHNLLADISIDYRLKDIVNAERKHEHMQKMLKLRF